ncbi:hypothetical protein MLD38_021501 [Melastoma candidum]|uniref:Uncharacterized protein n=1 Tax=Melastoma candidum TaxID=119954 RepID=A0ACB9QFI9_9MYRT|nr:hypothetical protein MLD38_021501 [Melastoma candidum]
MAEGSSSSSTTSYHVTQQSRRDKLRVLPHLPYDPSLLPPPPPPPPPAHSFLFPPSSPGSLVKEDPASSNLLSFLGGSPHHIYAPSANPSSSIRDRNPGLLCTSHSLGGQLGYPPYGSVDSAAGNNARGLSLSLCSRVNAQGGGGGNCNEQGNHTVPLALPLPLPYPLELNLESYGSGLGHRDSSRGDITIGPTGPFTGYSLVLRRSRFLKPAQQLLDEIRNAGVGIFAAAERGSESDPILMEGFGEGFGYAVDHCGVGGEKKSRLKSMLEEVCRRYKQCYKQLQNVVAYFECVPGLGNAAPYVNLALKVMSKHFRCLKDVIIDQFLFTMKAVRGDDVMRLEMEKRPHLGHRGIQISGILEHQPVWRPQRGLPEHAVTVLRAWLFDHFLHPYPTDIDKLMLAKETGLSRSQVSNWFINARVRLWKPMVEEIHMLEMQQKQKTSQALPRDERNVTQTSKNPFPSSSSVPSTSAPRLNNPLAMRTIGEIPADGSSLRNERTHLLSHVVGESKEKAKTSGVTLTLGLHHQNNNVMSVSTAVPVGAVQQRLGLGLEMNGEGHVMGGSYGLQERHFERDAYGGNVQVLRDFAG